MVEDLRFSNPADPQQWDVRAREIRERGPDGARPCLTLDHTNQYVSQVVNDSRQNKPAISFLPASGGARVEVAKALDGIVKHIEYQSRAQIAYDTAIEHAARTGLGWLRIVPEVVDAKLNYQEIRIKRIHDPLSVLCDPDWADPDGSDIAWGFVESAMSKRAFEAKYPKASADTWDSTHRGAGWVNDNGLRVCEYFERVQTKTNKLAIRLPDGSRRSVDEDEYWQVAKEIGTNPMLESQYTATDSSVKWRTMSGAEILEETDFPSCHVPLGPVVGCELWIEGKRHLAGMVRRMMEAQRAYNYSRSAEVEAVALQPKAPMLAAADSIAGHEAEWAGLNRRNAAYLPWNPYDDDGRQLPRPERMQPPAFPQAFAALSQNADNDLQSAVGMYRASLGAPTAEHSGIAIARKQREGDTANFHYIDNLSRSIERTGRIVLDMITRLYDEPREARILGDDGSAKPVKINPRGDAWALDGDVASINPSTGSYDVRVKAGPSYTTLRQEASESLQQMMRNPAVGPIVAPIWARMQDWPEADNLAKALLAMAPPPVQAALGDGKSQDDPEQLKQHMQQLEQQAQQMHQMLTEAAQKVQELQAQVNDKHLDMTAKAAELSIREYDSETKRLALMISPQQPQAMSPEQVQQLVMQTLQEAMSREPLGDAEHLERQASPGTPDSDPPQMPGAQQAPAMPSAGDQPTPDAAPPAASPDLAQSPAMQPDQQ